MSEETGLKGRATVSVLQDSQGFLWIGTSTGLARYNGVDFTVFTHSESDSTSLSDDFLAFNSLVEDQDGNIWAGTRGGLSRWNPHTETFTQYYASSDSSSADSSRSIFLGPSGNRISALFALPDGGVWVGTVKNGLSWFNPQTERFTHFRHNPDDSLTILSDQVFSITQDILGDIWVSTSGGISRFNEGMNRFEHVSLPFRISPGPSVSAIHGGMDNYLWIGTLENGLWRYDLFSGVLDAIPSDSLISTAVSEIYQDESGNLWVGTLGNGIHTYNPLQQAEARLTYVDEYDSGPSNNRICDIIVDRTGVVWVASWAGLQKGLQPMFSRHLTSEFNGGGFELREVQTLFQDDNGDILGGIREGGIFKINAGDNRIVQLSADPNLPLGEITNGIYSITRDHKGYLWFATDGDGAYRYDEATRELVSINGDEDSVLVLGSNQVTSIKEDVQRQLWFATAEAGISRLDQKTGTFHHFANSEDSLNSLSHSYAWPILEDSQNRIWVGTFGGGLNVLIKPNGFFRRYKTQDTTETVLSHNRVVSLMEASDSTLWIGTMGGGVNHFDPETETFKQWSIEEGFPSVNVICTLEENLQSFWMSTDAGLVHFNPETEESRVYNEHHGIPDATFSYGSCLKANDGTLYFGTRKGLISFRPEHIKQGDEPSVVITEVEALDTPVPIIRSKQEPDRVELKYRENFINIYFAALDFKAPAMNQFSFWLEGVDPEWSQPSTQPFTRYTELDPGTYTFFLKAADGYGAWSEETVALLIKVAPPFWLTWWFISGAGIIFGLSVIGYFRNRWHQKKQVEETKKRIANDLHDDLGSRLAALGIKLDTTILIKDPEELKKRLKLLSTRTRGIIQDLRNVTHLIENSGQESLTEIIELLRKQATALLPDNIRIHGTYPDVGKDLYVTMLWKQNITLIHSETLINIASHAEASEVTITIHVEQEYFWLRIKDNGIGFDTTSYEPGKGIASLENRAKRLNGSLAITSTPNAGTLVELMAPIKTKK